VLDGETGDAFFGEVSRNLTTGDGGIGEIGEVASLSSLGPSL